MNCSKSPWVFLFPVLLLTFSAESLIAERSLSRTKLERELKHLRESLHEAHRELAIKAERIEELSKELEEVKGTSAKVSQEATDSPLPPAAKTATRKEDAMPEKKDDAKPVPEKSPPSRKSPNKEKKLPNKEERTRETEKEAKRYLEEARTSQISISYAQNSAVNYEGRDLVLQFVRDKLKQNSKVRFSVRGFANDSSFEETVLDIAHNRARFLVDYLAFQGIPRDIFREVVGEASSEKGKAGRRVIIASYSKD